MPNKPSQQKAIQRMVQAEYVKYIRQGETAESASERARHFHFSALGGTLRAEIYEQCKAGAPEEELKKTYDLTDALLNDILTNCAAKEAISAFNLNVSKSRETSENSEKKKLEVSQAVYPTKRAEEIVALYQDGQSVREIAASLQLSMETVKIELRTYYENRGGVREQKNSEDGSFPFIRNIENYCAKNGMTPSDLLALFLKKKENGRATFDMIKAGLVQETLGKSNVFRTFVRGEAERITRMLPAASTDIAKTNYTLFDYYSKTQIPFEETMNLVKKMGLIAAQGTFSAYHIKKKDLFRLIDQKQLLGSPPILYGQKISKENVKFIFGFLKEAHIPIVRGTYYPATELDLRGKLPEGFPDRVEEQMLREAPGLKTWIALKLLTEDPNLPCPSLPAGDVPSFGDSDPVERGGTGPWEERGL